ncbi:MAG: hypothetical protein ABI794_04975 [Betaproteobacteria bacterium]
MPLMHFDDFTAGSTLGRHEETIDESLVAPWRSAFPDGPQHPSPGGFAMAFAMRAYLTILPERPPGNIHARQRLSLHRALAPGDRVAATLSCIGAELRNGRRRVVLRVNAVATDELLFEAEMTILWAL